MSGVATVMLIANLQLVAQVPSITVAVQDDAGVPREWLRQANNELEWIYREIDVDIVWWDPNLPSPRDDQATVPRNLSTIAIRRNARIGWIDQDQAVREHIKAPFTIVLVNAAAAQTPVLLGFMESDIRLAVRRAIEGAAARLAHPGCQDLFADFTDEGGQRLSTTLAASGKSPTEALSVLRFFDDGAAPQCRAGTALAFTQVGSRLIRICGRQFRDWFQQNRTTTEIVVIHEFLHTLGLGENPPTSRAITERVAARCGG